MSVTDELLANAEHHSSTFDQGALTFPPARRTAVVACTDARLDVYGLLVLQEGDAHVIRNAGGSFTQDELAGGQPSSAGDDRDRPHPPHRLRDADVYRRHVPPRDRGGEVRSTDMGR